MAHTKTLTVEEIKLCLFDLRGITSVAGGINTIITPGIINEKYISEGVRRICNKVAKILESNYPEKRLQEIQAMTIGSIDWTVPSGQEGPTEAEKLKTLAETMSRLTKELQGDKVTMEFEELPDWKIMNQGLEDRKQNLSTNYSYVFEKLFLNY